MAAPIILALDGLERPAALSLAEKVAGKVFAVKVHDLYLAEGPALVGALKRHGRVWVDLKFHDIPATVRSEVKRLVSAGADLLTVHASGGREMIEAAVEAGGPERILAVTVLTSLSWYDCRALFGDSPELLVQRLGRLAAETGARGIVCSPLEAKALAADASTANLWRVTPGIRPTWYQDPGDQKRVATPREALAGGSTHLVIGRPIVQAPDPSAALDRTIAELGAR
ncbi:MAG: orotidine-5'-phosphate decarboxylase [Planctomycetales bacterium]|nr:orotidine-5'-phosphate decarboxylase [Planctomycetales bacterium]